jgi:ribosomal protein S18 acetylase RimI-like enzyme
MRLRDARPGEGARLAALVGAQPLLLRYQVDVAKLGADLEQALARGDSLVVVEVDGAPRGFAWFLLRGTFAAGGYLRLIALQPGAENSGLGAALLDEVEARVAQVSRHLFLLVSHWNEAAQRFYRRRGYVEVGRLPGFVRADTDELIWQRRLR